MHRYAEALPQGLDAPPAGLEAFRGGLTKIGSGDAIGLDALRTWAGAAGFPTVEKTEPCCTVALHSFVDYSTK